MRLRVASIALWDDARACAPSPVANPANSQMIAFHGLMSNRSTEAERKPIMAKPARMAPAAYRWGPFRRASSGR